MTIAKVRTNMFSFLTYDSNMQIMTDSRYYILIL